MLKEQATRTRLLACIEQWRKSGKSCYLLVDVLMELCMERDAGEALSMSEIRSFICTKRSACPEKQHLAKVLSLFGFVQKENNGIAPFVYRVPVRPGRKKSVIMVDDGGYRMRYYGGVRIEYKKKNEKGKFHAWQKNA